MTLFQTRSYSFHIGTGLFALACMCAASAHAQQLPIGSVSLEDATVVGAASTDNNRAVIIGNGSVTAKDHSAFVQLFRGGSVAVCATSGLHLTSGSPAAPDVSATAPPADANASIPAPPPGASSSQPPLMLALDRGALELRMSAIASDVLMTPDLRFEFSEAGQLDVRIRVNRNGDTCVDNRVAGLSEHPTLRVGSLFGSDTYDILPGQHVLFERADLHEVVDNESSPCGCPQAEKPTEPATLGELTLHPGDKTPGTVAANLHPFPTAVSQGLAPPPPVPQAPPGVVHTQITTNLVYPPPAPGAPAKKDDASPAGPSSAPPKPGFFRSIGRFFKRVFNSPPDIGSGVQPHN